MKNRIKSGRECVVITLTLDWRTPGFTVSCWCWGVTCHRIEVYTTALTTGSGFHRHTHTSQQCLPPCHSLWSVLSAVWPSLCGRSPQLRPEERSCAHFIRREDVQYLTLGVSFKPAVTGFRAQRQFSPCAEDRLLRAARASCPRLYSR